MQNHREPHPFLSLDDLPGMPRWLPAGHLTGDQTRHFRGAVTACSRLCVLRAHTLRAQQRQREQEEALA